MGVTEAARANRFLGLVRDARENGRLSLLTFKGAPAAYIVPADLVEAAASFDRSHVAVPACQAIRDQLGALKGGDS
jgi:hypothetical protein